MSRDDKGGNKTPLFVLSRLSRESDGKNKEMPVRYDAQYKDHPGV